MAGAATGEPPISPTDCCNASYPSATTIKSVGPASSEHNPVTRPAHYRAHPSGVECIQITRHMNFNLGNAFKYIWRAGLKGEAVEDLRKAAFYIADEIARLEAEKPRQPEQPTLAAELDHMWHGNVRRWGE